MLLGACGATATTDNSSDAATLAKVAAFQCPPAAIDAGSSRTPSGARLKVVTTVAPITSIVANVAGTFADVAGLIPEGTNSHTYEPKPSAAQLLGRADVIFINGLKLEDPTKDLAEANAKSAEILELGTLALSPDQYIYDFSFPKDGGKPNPHLWTNPPMAKCYAEIAASSLAKADPANAAGYAANAKAYAAKIDELDRLMIAASASIPASSRKLLTYHDAYAYFSAHYGFEVIGAIQVSSFEDPTPKEVAKLIEQIKSQKVPAIFGSEVFPSPVLAQIGKESGAKYIDVLRDDDLPGGPGDPDHSFLGLMKFDFVTMVTALGGDATALTTFNASDTAPDGADYPQ
jgi:ABC-type Zn uptake system ZnuABC Zn-binding protein ZnuA